MKTTIEEPVLELDTLRVESLPELQGWREKQQAIVAENPFISIEDNKSYQDAKKNRTALVSARTDIEKQEKIIASKLREFRTKVGEVSKELVDITQPHEEKQQEEVKRYEQEKENERIEKERIENERKENLQKEIDTFYSTWKKVISEMKFKDIDSQKKEIVTQLKEKDDKNFAEFQDDFNEKVKFLRDQFQERVKFLTEREEARKEQEKLAAERAEYEAQKAKEEAARKAHEAKIDAERKAEAEKLRKEREELEAEIKRIADEEAKRKAAIAAEQKAEEEAEAKAKSEAEEKKRKAAEAKRLKALAPDKEKALTYITSFEPTEEYPKLKDPSAVEVLEALTESYNDWIASAIDRINHLK